MSSVRQRGEVIRQFILENVEKSPSGVVSLACAEFGISRQAINKHIKTLVEQGSISVSGATRSRKYALKPIVELSFPFSLEDGIGEDIVWRDHMRDLLGNLPDNVIDIWHYGVTEMFNNAIDHSSGTKAIVSIKKTAVSSEIRISDNGEGIFKKIQRVLQLEDERHSVLELAKGKLTTDPENHSGEGIFFSSRMFDQFAILSGNVYFSHDYDEVEDWILEYHEATVGTVVVMKLPNNTSRTLKKVFNKFSVDSEYGFTKTVVPVRMTQYGDDKLVSRSQAKRLLARVDRFKVVMFDFSEVDSIGQAFADEIFRVFVAQHPEIEVLTIHSNADVDNMINRAKAVI